MRAFLRLLAVAFDQPAAHFLEEVAGIGRAHLGLLAYETERQGLGR